MSHTIEYKAGDVEHAVQVEAKGEQLLVRIDNEHFTITAQAGESGRIDLCVEGVRRRAYVTKQGSRTYVWLDGDVWTLEKPAPRRRGEPSADRGSSLDAAMPGRVLDVLVAEGDEVKRGDTLVLLEAMKMELRIQAASAGRVERIHVKAGAVVERGQRLVSLV